MWSLIQLDDGRLGLGVYTQRNDGSISIYHYHDRLRVRTIVFQDATVYESKPSEMRKNDNKYAYFKASIKGDKKACNKKN